MPTCTTQLMQVKMCLVINKIDRLILELRLSPQEAYERMKAIIAHVNMILSSFRSERYISGAQKCRLQVAGCMLRTPITAPCALTSSRCCCWCHAHTEADSVLAYEDKRAAAAEGAAAAAAGGSEDGEEQAEDERQQRQQREDDEEEAQELSPAKGNVAFGSAYDGWAFRIGQFAELYAGAHAANGALESASSCLDPAAAMQACTRAPAAPLREVP